MPNRDRYHDALRRALEKDGWLIADAQQSLGQYFLYLSVIKRLDPDRKLYLAIHEEVYEEFFEEPLGELILSDYQVPIIVFDPNLEVIVRWID